MNRYNHPQHLKPKDYVLRSVFAIIAIALLSFFCPRESIQKLQYTLGEPWNENSIIAEDSFNIYLSEQELQQERDTLQRRYEPYYKYNPLVKQEQVGLFKHDLDSIAAELMLSNEAKKYIISKLEDAYDDGIMPDSSYEIIAQRKIYRVHLYAEESETVNRELLFNSEKAYKNILSERNVDIANALKHIKLDRYIKPNLAYDEQKSAFQQKEIDRLFTRFAGQVKIGEKIVDKGQIVDQSTYNKLVSYEKKEKEFKKTTSEEWNQLGGQVLYISMLVLCLFFFFNQFRSDYLFSLRHMLLISMLCLFFPILTYLLKEHFDVNEYVIPYCIQPIFIRVFMDSRTAFVTHLVSILLSVLAIQCQFEFVTIELLAGLTAIYSLKQLQQRSELFVAVISVIGVSMLTHLSIHLIKSDSFAVDYKTYTYIACGGGLTLLSYLFLFPIEKLFRFTSTVTLVELSNINNEVLRRLSEEAPGTFQHSMQVANLSAEVANKLGANAQLVRTGALYHDIGKLKNPVFFTENQSGVNPHSTLPYEDSAQIIIHHVKYGLELAKKYRLPQSIKDFIASHHGRSKTKYFYVSYKNEHLDREINEEIFTYPGPNPMSLEEAILMMADAVEAASRSLPEYTEESISNLVDKIIDGQVSEGYFRRCPITFENIDTAKQMFKEKLKSIYHTRISYPELKK